MKLNTKRHPYLFNLPAYESGFGGCLTVLENSKIGLFCAKRIYFISNVNFNQVRGNHAHKKLRQIFVVASGSFQIKLENHRQKFEFEMDATNKALYVPNGYWRTLKNFSNDGVCVVLASEEYDTEDYIHNKDDFLNWSVENN